MSKASIQQLPDLFSNLTPNVHLLHLSVLRQQSNQRAGTASTKTKGEVRGGGKKPWKQKGTGRARAGYIRSPLWVGGGITFGPKPRSFKFKIPQKARNLALAQAIASKSENIVILNKLPEIKDGKTKTFLAQAKSAGIMKTPLLFICKEGEPNCAEVKRTSRNVPEVELKDQKFVGVYDVLKANTIVITESAISELEKRFSKLAKGKAKKA